MFIYQLVVKVEFGHFLCELSPAFSCLFGTSMPTGGLIEFGLMLNFPWALRNGFLLPWTWSFFMAFASGWFFHPVSVKTGNVVFPDPCSTSFHLWGISRCQIFWRVIANAWPATASPAPWCLAEVEYVDWFSLSIREQWFSNFSDKKCRWMLIVASALGH